MVVELDPVDYNDFRAAVHLLRKRSMSAFVHEYAIDTINMAREKFSDEEFRRAAEEVSREITKRSRKKSAERRKRVLQTPPPAKSATADDKAA
ncbi:MAG: hypothetical protein M3348_13280 [Acidobacteriota bacterium]|nr:hypothetical protein [Acidobacteriota bacterium]